MNDKLTFAYALTGSFCTFDKSVNQIKKLVEKNINVLPIMSFNAYKTDTRFGKAKDFVKKIEEITSHKVIATLEDAEPIGPKKMADLLVVLPCTGTTVAKLKNGIYDTPVTLAVKSHLRNLKPVVIGISTNDALSTTAKNIGELMNYKNYYFIPFSQDSPDKKPASIVCRFELLYETCIKALNGSQIQPVLIKK